MTNNTDFDSLLETEQGLLAGIAESDQYIEECINKKEPIQKVLRLLVMRSLTMGGFNSRRFEFFRNEIVQQYGYKYLFVLENLLQLRLFTTESTYNFKLLRKKLNLITENMDIQNPKDYAYVYGGYAPVSVRLIHEALRNDGFPAESENPLYNLFQTQKDAPTVKFEQEGARKSVGGRRVVLVFFIGGVTFAEISALRWLSQQYENISFIVATTQMINGNSLLNSLIFDSCLFFL